MTTELHPRVYEDGDMRCGRLLCGRLRCRGELPLWGDGPAAGNEGPVLLYLDGWETRAGVITRMRGSWARGRRRRRDIPETTRIAFAVDGPGGMTTTHLPARICCPRCGQINVLRRPLSFVLDSPPKHTT